MFATDPASPHSSAPRVLASRFELREQIGSGGASSVWRAFDRKTGREVAVKQLRAHDAGMLLRFVREQALRFRHPNIAAPSGWAADDDIVVLSMDLVRGGSVETLVRDHGAIPDSFAAVLLQQLLLALAEIHDHGVVHRDIKPANLLLEPTGSARPQLRVADFGIAVVRDEPRLTETRMSIGTPGYLAPDAAQGAEPAPHHDLYAAGVVAKRLVTGMRPSDFPAEHPSRLWPVLEWLTDPDPQRRPRTAREVLQRLADEQLVPEGAPWQNDDDAPFVFDQFANAAPDTRPEPASATRLLPSPDAQTVAFTAPQTPVPQTSAPQSPAPQAPVPQTPVPQTPAPSRAASEARHESTATASGSSKTPATGRERRLRMVATVSITLATLLAAASAVVALL